MCVEARCSKLKRRYIELTIPPLPFFPRYTNVRVGDTLSWWVKRVGDSKVFPMQFEIGWRSESGNGNGSMVQNVTEGARFMWATEAEAYFGINETNYDFLPQSPYNIWDIVVKDQDGKPLAPDWKCQQSGGITLDCDWTGPGGEKGISMAFPQKSVAKKTLAGLVRAPIKTPKGEVGGGDGTCGATCGGSFDAGCGSKCSACCGYMWDSHCAVDDGASPCGRR